MNLVDSSGWLEYFADDKNSDFFTTAIEDTENLIVSTINIYEVFKHILQQRNENDAMQAVAVMHNAQVVDVTSALSLSAARISYETKLPMADSLILATAKSMNATFWTQDSDFKEIPNVKYINK